MHRLGLLTLVGLGEWHDSHRLTLRYAAARLVCTAATPGDSLSESEYALMALGYSLALNISLPFSFSRRACHSRSAGVIVAMAAAAFLSPVPPSSTPSSSWAAAFRRASNASRSALSSSSMAHSCVSVYLLHLS